MPTPAQPWSPADATRLINGCAAGELDLSRTGHAIDQMRDRGLIMGDLLHLLRRGFVYDAPEPATRGNLFKYRIEGTTPNSDGRAIAAIVIPDGGCALKIVTVMWRDER